MISGLVAAFSANVAGDPAISNEVSKQVEVQMSAGGSFVASAAMKASAEAAGHDTATVEAMAEPA